MGNKSEARKDIASKCKDIVSKFNIPSQVLDEKAKITNKDMEWVDKCLIEMLRDA